MTRLAHPVETIACAEVSLAVEIELDKIARVILAAPDKIFRDAAIGEPEQRLMEAWAYKRVEDAQ